MSGFTLASTSRRWSSRCFCSSSRLLASEATPSATPDLSATPNAVESTTGHAGSAAAPPEVPVTEQRGGKGAGRKAASLNAWLQGEGSRYRRPMNKSTNWLARTPFPANPSFAPKPPMSDLMRNHIYSQVKQALSKKQSGGSEVKEGAVLRQIAQKHNISMQRVAAIVKLKVAQEQHVQAGFALQKEFNDGMESALGVSTRKEPIRISEPVEGTKPILTHQMRQVFEMPDQEAGEQPILPSMLDAAASGKSTAPKTSSSKASAASQEQIWRVPSRRKEASPTIVVENVSNTPLGRSWERTNKNDSASDAVKVERAEQRKAKQHENAVAWEAYT